MGEFSDWFRNKYGNKAVFINTTSTTSQDLDPATIDAELFDLLQELWKSHNVSTGGYKSWGGAGTVAWLDNGNLVDHDFVSIIESLGQIQRRTETAFGTP